MTIVVPDVGEVLLLKYMLNHTPSTDVRIHLYTSNITPSDSHTLSTYSSNEVSDSYYTPATCAGTAWTVSTVAGVTTATYTDQFFSFSTSQSIYGVYATNASDTQLLWADRFTVAPYDIASGGGVIRYTPEIDAD